MITKILAGTMGRILLVPGNPSEATGVFTAQDAMRMLP